MDKRFLLKDQRSQLGLTQIDLAKQLEVSNNTVARWESGVLPISRIVELAMERLVSIHSFKGVSVAAMSPPGVSSSVSETPKQTASDNADTMSFVGALKEFERIGKPKSDSSLRRYLQSKRLKGELVGGEWKIKKSDFESFINSDFFKSLK
jgi:transcriptional regulator with XRE-family HTH domain